jgi:Ni/Co efflux regulator RcnB
MPVPLRPRSLAIGLLAAAVFAAGVAAAPAPAAAQSAAQGKSHHHKKKVRKGKRGKPAQGAASAAPTTVNKADREADRHFKTGVELFDERKYAEALAEFEQAYALKPHPLVLNNLAATHRALSQYDQAVDFYNRFLVEGEGKLTAEQLARGRAELEDLLRVVARVEVITAPEGAQVHVDGRSMGGTPLDDPLVLGPGDHTVVASLSGYRQAERKIRVAAGDTLRVEFALEAESEAPVAAATPAAEPEPIEEAPAQVAVTTPRPRPRELRRFGVNASYGANALEVSDTGAPVVGVGFAFTDRFSVGVDVILTGLAAAPSARFRLFGDTISVHAVAAVPVAFKDGDDSETFAAAAGGLGLRVAATSALALRIETWVSYAGQDHGTTLPTFAGAELWF